MSRWAVVVLLALLVGLAVLLMLFAQDTVTEICAGNYETYVQYCLGIPPPTSPAR